MFNLSTVLSLDISESLRIGNPEGEGGGGTIKLIYIIAKIAPVKHITFPSRFDFNSSMKEKVISLA